MAIILYNDIRLSRNLKGYKFPPMLEFDDAREIIDKVYGVMEGKSYQKILTSNMSSLERLRYFEENKASDILANDSISALFVAENMPAISVNGLDHISIYDASKDFNLCNIYKKISKIDDSLDEFIDYAYNEKFGYLTTNPNMCGTAMSASVYLHLPASEYFGISILIGSLKKLGYSISQLVPTKVKKCPIYKFTRDSSIGVSEDVYLERLSELAKEIVDIEKQNRKKLYLDKIIDLEDIANRAFGLLSYARLISEEEMVSNLSDLFMGIELNILKPLEKIDFFDTINSLKDTSLQMEKESLLDAKSRNILRANKLRKIMKEVF